MPAGVVTLLSIRTACKSQSDNVGQSFDGDSEWNQFIQEGYSELYGKIVTAFGNDYFTQGTSPYTFTTDGINSLFALPDGSGAFPAFFKLLGVDLKIQGGNNQFLTLKPFSFADRNKYAAFNQTVPMAGQTIRVHYVPRLTLPTQDSDTIDGVNGWESWMIVYACMKAAVKEESDATAYFTQMGAIEKRLDAEIENRDAGMPARIVDVYGRTAAGMGYRLNGNNLWLIGGSTAWWPSWGGDFEGCY